MKLLFLRLHQVNTRFCYQEAGPENFADIIAQKTAEGQLTVPQIQQMALALTRIKEEQRHLSPEEFRAIIDSAFDTIGPKGSIDLDIITTEVEASIEKERSLLIKEAADAIYADPELAGNITRTEANAFAFRLVSNLEAAEVLKVITSSREVIKKLTFQDLTLMELLDALVASHEGLGPLAADIQEAGTMTDSKWEAEVATSARGFEQLAADIDKDGIVPAPGQEFDPSKANHQAIYDLLVANTIDGDMFEGTELAPEREDALLLVRRFAAALSQYPAITPEIVEAYFDPDTKLADLTAGLSDDRASQMAIGYHLLGQLAAEMENVMGELSQAEKQPEADATDTLIDNEMLPAHEDIDTLDLDAPLTRAEFDRFWQEILEDEDSTRVIPVHLKEALWAQTRASIETEGKRPEEVAEETKKFIHQRITDYKIGQFDEYQLDGQAMPDDAEQGESLVQVATRIAGEFEGVSPENLMQAMANNMNHVGEYRDGVPVYKEEEIRELAEKLQAQGEVVHDGLVDAGYTPGTPEYQQAYDQAMANYVDIITLDEVTDIWSFLLWVLQQAYPEKYGINGPTDAYGNPLNTSTGTGQNYPDATMTAKGRLDSMEAYNGGIQLSESFYGSNLMTEFGNLGLGEAKEAEVLAEVKTIADSFHGGIEGGWGRAVLRNAVNSYKHGNAFGANRVFAVHDVGTQTMAIYVPGAQTKYVPVTHGKGIGNVPGSNQTPLGSFDIGSMTHLGKNSGGRAGGDRYNYRMHVKGMEPMKSNMNASREAATRMDPGAGNTNSHDRAIRIHDTGGGTAGCTGMRNEDAKYLSEALITHGGGNMEVVVSVGRS